MVIINQTISKTEYAGLSTETKPTGCYGGSTFYETDTGKEWIYNGSEWTEKSSEFNTIVTNITFQNAVTTTGTGTEFTVDRFKTLRMSIYGTATARTVQFFEKNVNGDLVPVLGYNISTGALATSTSGTSSETWIFDISGLNKIVAKVNAISGGNLTVAGMAVS